MNEDLFSRFRPARSASSPSSSDDSDPALAYRPDPGAAIGKGPDEVELLAAIEQMPSLPMVVHRILALVSDRLSSASDLEQLVKCDVVITARLLRLVNSPFYGLSNHVASVTQAVTMIGFSSLRSLVLAASVSDLLDIDLVGYGYIGRGLWKNAIATATLARAIALQTHHEDEVAEEFFVAGLMRDIGMLVLGRFLARGHHVLRRGRGDGDILHLERAAVGFDHCWVGDRIGERWLLPSRLRLCISKHHRIPTNVSAADLRQLAAVRLAERVAYNARIGVIDDHPFDTRIDGILLQASGLDGKGFEQLVRSVPDIIAASEIDFN